MRHSVWLLPAALVLAGPVASALAQGCPGIVSRVYPQAQQSSAPQTLSPIIYQGPVTASGQPVGAYAGAAASAQPMVIYQGPGSASAPMLAGGESGSPPIIYQPQPAPHPGLLGRLFHRDAEQGMTPAMSNGPMSAATSEPNVSVQPAPSPMPAMLPAAMPQTMPGGPAMTPGPLNGDKPEPHGLWGGNPGRLFHHDAPASANPNMPYIVTSASTAGGGQAKYIVLPAAGEMPPALAAPQAANAAIVPVAMNRTEPPAAEAPVLVDFPINPEFITKTGFRSDYASITGQLYHVQSEDAWLVRYAPMELGDRNGGLVVLETSVNMKDFHEGDLVTVQGSLSTGKHGSSMFNAPLYKAERVDLLEHGQP